MASHYDLWDRRLTTKLVSLLKIKPIIAIRDLIIRDEKLKDQFRHYDPLAITIKILEVIIDHMGPFSGISQDDLIERITPLLRRMDQVENITHFTSEDHRRFVETILNKLLNLSKKEGFRLLYTDYSQHPPLKREVPFRLISHRNFDGTNIVLVAETAAINFFLQMLDIDIEDQQLAHLQVLSLQIKKGHFISALDTAKNNILLTKQFMLKIRNIINQTRRDLSTVDWLHECPQELKKTTEHIRDCIDTETMQLGIINQKLEITPDDKMVHLIQLKNYVSESLDLLLPLQTEVNGARETFLDEQWVQELLVKRQKGRIEFESMGLDQILAISAQKFITLLDEAFVFFSRCTIPAQFTYNQFLYQIIHRISQIKPHKIIEKEQFEIIMEPFDLTQYPKSLRSEVAKFIVEYLHVNRKVTTLSEILQYAEGLGKGFLFCNYLRLLIQGRVAKEYFEKHILDHSLDVQVHRRPLETTWFFGDDYLISLEANPRV